MGCSHSTTKEYGQQTEVSVTELLIAKRPGGSDVGPIRNSRRESKIEEGDKKKLSTGAIIFSVVKVVADNDGVIFYHFSGSSAEDPSNQLHIAKRYTDFKTLHAEISKLMGNERIVSVAQPALPEMPKADVWTYLRGRYNDQILEEREEQFTRILNAMTRHPVAFRSTSFTNFLLN